jgi:hypothetical protein
MWCVMHAQLMCEEPVCDKSIHAQLMCEESICGESILRKPIYDELTCCELIGRDPATIGRIFTGNMEPINRELTPIKWALF